MTKPQFHWESTGSTSGMPFARFLYERSFDHLPMFDMYMEGRNWASLPQYEKQQWEDYAKVCAAYFVP